MSDAISLCESTKNGDFQQFHNGSGSPPIINSPVFSHFHPDEGHVATKNLKVKSKPRLTF